MPSDDSFMITDLPSCIAANCCCCGFSCTREVFLYYQKLELERKMKIIAGHPKGYEDMRFQTRSNSYLLTVEGHCKFCQHYTPLGVELLDYREKTIEDRNEMFGCVVTDCPVCKIHSLFIPNLLY